MSTKYRPWGLLNWVLAQCDVRGWSLLGCIGTEKRSLSAWKNINSTGKLNSISLLRIIDCPSKYSERSQKKIWKRENEFIALGGDVAVIKEYDLLKTAHHEIVSIVENFLDVSGSNVILDVTSLPKRFFFPILKILINNRDRIENLIVTYSIPETYLEGKLAENCNDYAHLPLFNGEYGEQNPDMLIVGVGFEAHGLKKQIEHSGTGLQVKLLLPFPAPPSVAQRSWELVRKLKKYSSADIFNLYRVDPKDVSDGFNRLLNLTQNGEKKAVLAPFGPKPMSVAMCVFATLTNSEVFYSQPTIYHPDYSTGVNLIDGIPETYGYCLRLQGKDFYSV